MVEPLRLKAPSILAIIMLMIIIRGNTERPKGLFVLCFVLYAGPCMTDMFKSVADTSHSQSVRDMFQGQIDKKEYLTCQQSISKLMELLRENRFENAAVIDYYDKNP